MIMMEANNFVILTLIIALLVLAIILYVVVPKVTVTTSSISSSLTTFVTIGNFMAPPAYRIGNYTFTGASQFPVTSGLPIFQGYVGGVIFVYRYSNNMLLLRFLAYLNNTSALNAYDHISNYTHYSFPNSTSTLLAPLPNNYAGIKILRANTIIYTISVLHNNTVITATLVEHNVTGNETSNVVGFLINASKLLFNRP